MRDVDDELDFERVKPGDSINLNFDVLIQNGKNFDLLVPAKFLESYEFRDVLSKLIRSYCLYDPRKEKK